jgi:ribosomal protein S18 acetylase RimI-like enzyme
MDEIKVEVIPAMMVPIVARQTAMESHYAKKIVGMMDKDELVLLAARREVDGFVDNYIGRVSLWLAQPEEPEVWKYARDAALINALYVNERARSQGIAKHLMKAAEDEAKHRNKTLLAVGVEPTNTSARHLYETLGYAYRKCGNSDTYKAEWEVVGDAGETTQTVIDALLMVKEL